MSSTNFFIYGGVVGVEESVDRGRQNRFDRGGSKTGYASPPRRESSVSPPRCAAEMPRPYVGHREYRDVSPLGAPVAPRAKAPKTGDDVSIPEVVVSCDDSTDDLSWIVSTPTICKNYTRPDELFLPDVETVKRQISSQNRYTRPDELSFPGVEFAKDQVYSRGRVVSESKGREIRVVRTVTAVEVPMLQRSNAVRQRPEASLRHAPREGLKRRRTGEFGTTEYRLGLLSDS